MLGRTLELADIPVLQVVQRLVEKNVVSQERQPLWIAKYRATTEFGYAVSSGVKVFFPGQGATALC